MKASQIESIQSALARIQQQKGRRLTAGERLFITNHQVAHALVNIRGVDGYPIADTMAGFYCYIDMNSAIAETKGECWPFNEQHVDYIPQEHEVHQYQQLPVGWRLSSFGQPLLQRGSSTPVLGRKL